MAKITEYGEVLINDIDEWGGRKIDGLLDEGTLVIVVTAGPGWTGKISGVTNPAKIMGVAVANIAKVKGVA